MGVERLFAFGIFLFFACWSFHRYQTSKLTASRWGPQGCLTGRSTEWKSRTFYAAKINKDTFLFMPKTFVKDYGKLFLELMLKCWWEYNQTSSGPDPKWWSDFGAVDWPRSSPSKIYGTSGEKVTTNLGKMIPI